MTNDELIQHLERQMEECAQMGEPPSFGLESQADMRRILKALRVRPTEEAIMYAKRTCDPNVLTWSHDMTRTMAAEILRLAGEPIPVIAEGSETKQ